MGELLVDSDLDPGHLVTLLTTGEVDGHKLNDEEILQESLLILIGGDETTRHVMTGGLEQLMLHPDQKQKLQDDPSKMEIAVEEMLRWVQKLRRGATEAERCLGGLLLLTHGLLLYGGWRSGSASSPRTEPP